MPDELKYLKDMIAALTTQVHKHTAALEQCARVVNAHSQSLKTFSEQYTASFQRVGHDMNSVMDRLEILETQKQEQDNSDDESIGTDSGEGDGLGDGTRDSVIGNG